jgi:transposase-like protein
MTRRSRHEVAYAVADIEDARDELRTLALPALNEGPVTAAALQVGARAIEDVLDRLADVQARLTQHVAGAGVPISEASRCLGVSEPTIRTWVGRGVLERIPGAKPVLIEIAALRHVERAVRERRERGQDRDWVRALVDALHDRVERRTPETVAGLDELRRDMLEPA